MFETAQFGAIADRLADKFGTRGLPITLSTACASGATAIQLGVEAIRRGECDRALSIGADGSATAEALIRFSLLSALSTHNDDPGKGVEAVLQGPRRLRAGRRLGRAGAGIAGKRASRAARPSSASCKGCGEKADDFHRTRSKPDGSPAIAAVRAALGRCRPGRRRDIGYVNAHGTSTPENDKMEHLSLSTVFGERMRKIPGLVEQVDDRPHAVGGRRDRGGVLAADDARRRHPADHQLRQSRSGDRPRRGAEREAHRRCRDRAVQFLRLRRPEHLPCHGAGTPIDARTATDRGPPARNGRPAPASAARRMAKSRCASRPSRSTISTSGAGAAWPSPSASCRW